MMPALRYAVEEAFASLWRGRRSAVLSIGTIAVALFVLGAFLGLTVNLERLADDWRQAAELSVFLADDVGEVDQRAIETHLAPSAVVASRSFVSKSDALARFKQMFSDLATTADALAANPLPASYEVRLQPGIASDAVEALAARVRLLPGVADVRYDRQWLDCLLAAVSLVRRIGLGLGALLTLAAALTVGNVVRLALYARRDEIAIMQLVGAPTVYVRGPFIVEGVLQGGLGALLAIAALSVAFWTAHGRFLVPLAAALNMSAVRFLPVTAAIYLMLGGMFVGCLGGILATRAETR